MIFWALLGLMILENLAITFDDSLFRENWLEGKPELFLIIRDDCWKNNSTRHLQKVHLVLMILKILLLKSQFQKKIILLMSPYDSVNARRIAAFGQIGDSINVTDNIVNSSQLLLQSLNAWLLYSNETIWNKIGYDGPQVERYPWRNPHTHRLKWNDA